MTGDGDGTVGTGGSSLGPARPPVGPRRTGRNRASRPVRPDRSGLVILAFLALWLFGIATAGVLYGVWGAVAYWIGFPVLVIGAAVTGAWLHDELGLRGAMRRHPAGSGRDGRRVVGENLGRTWGRRGDEQTRRGRGAEFRESSPQTIHRLSPARYRLRPADIHAYPQLGAEPTATEVLRNLRAVEAEERDPWR